MTYLKAQLSDQQSMASESWSKQKKKLGFPGAEDALYFNIYLIIIPKEESLFPWVLSSASRT